MVERVVVNCDGDLDKAAKILRKLKLDPPSTPPKPSLPSTTVVADAAVGDAHGRHRLRQPCLFLPQNRTCVRGLPRSRLPPQTLDGLVGMLSAIVPLVIGWVFG